MIEYNYEFDFLLSIETNYTHWLTRVLKSEDKSIGQINYIFCSDEYLYNLNHKFLNHDTLTDIITFDYSDNSVISGDIYISVERVKENAFVLNEKFDKELKRVMVHGLLHMIGFNDKTTLEKSEMRRLEEEKIIMFHVEQ